VQKSASSPEPNTYWAGLRALFTPKPTGSSEDEIAELRGAISEAANLLRNYTVGYLAVALYLVVVAVNTSHEQLLIGKEIILPIVSVGVPLVGFYVLAPVVLLAIHGNLLYHLQALARRVQWFNECLGETDPTGQERMRRLLVPFQFVEWRAGAKGVRKVKFSTILLHGGSIFPLL
jgi:hypothetical protein